MRVRVAGIAALLSAAVLVAGLTQATAAPPPDPGDSKKQVDAKVDRLKADLDAASRSLVAAEAAYNTVQSQLVPARAAATRARTWLDAARASDAVMRNRLRSAARAEREAERALRQVDSDIAQDRKTTGQMARAAYQQGPLAQLIPVMQAETPGDFAQRMASVQSVMRSQNAALDRLRNVRAETTRREAALAARRAEAARERRAAAATLFRTRQAEQVAAAARARVEGLLDERQDAVAAIRAERAADLARYNEMRAEQRRLAELIRRLEAERKAGGESDGPVVQPGSGALSRPVDGPVTSGFGPRFHPILQITKLHTGTDFSASTGTPVGSAGAGKVITVENTRAYGNRVIVSHGSVNGKSLVTTYNHLSDTSVRSGQPVDRGELVGKAGSTGYSTGPHLHFEVLVGGEFEDPMKWL